MKNDNSFNQFALAADLQKSLAKMHYKSPTPIQKQTIPLALKGRDIMGSAQTGTGKTAAFAIPLVQNILTNKRGSALVLTPTRELGKQVMEVIHDLTRFSKVNTAFLIGGEAMTKQLNQLKRDPRIIVGTPGRINDHLERGTLNLQDCHFLVLDETDRMLDMGFSVQLDRIFKHMPSERQSLMFSATLPDNIIKLSKKYLNEPERIAVGSTIKPAKNIKQSVIKLKDEEKYPELVQQLEQREGSVIVFVKTKRGADRLAKRLDKEGFKSEPMHGDLKQNKRDRVIKNYRDMKFRILIATDVAARGLDIPHIAHVVNYDLPQVPEDYIHRIGRTARAGASGEAVCFLSPKDSRKWHAIELLINPEKTGSADDKSDGPKKKRSPNKRNGHKKNRWSFSKKKKQKAKAKTAA